MATIPPSQVGIPLANIDARNPDAVTLFNVHEKLFSHRPLNIDASNPEGVSLLTPCGARPSGRLSARPGQRTRSKHSDIQDK